MVYRTGVEAVPRLHIAEQPDLCAKAEITHKASRLLVLGACQWEGLLKSLSVLDYCQSDLSKQWLHKRTVVYIKPVIAVISYILHF